MTTGEQIIECLARAEGYTDVTNSCASFLGVKDGLSEYVPDYLTSLDALQPLIDGLDDEQIDAYHGYLWDAVGEEGTLKDFHQLKVFQKAEALFKTLKGE